MLWVTYNVIKERFSGTVYEKISYVGLIGLLILNTLLILRDKKEVKATLKVLKG